MILPKPELAEKGDINQISAKQDTLIKLYSLFNEQLKDSKEYRITNRECNVKLKPQTRNIILSNLPKGFELVVLQVHHQWVFVSYFDPKDNLPQSGWVMKKYLDKSK